MVVPVQYAFTVLLTLFFMYCVRDVRGDRTDYGTQKALSQHLVVFQAKYVVLPDLLVLFIALSYLIYTLHLL